MNDNTTDITVNCRKLSLAISALCVLSCTSFASAEASDFNLPDETWKALELESSATPKKLHDALSKRYYDPEQGFGEGSLAEFWEPIPITKYLAPASFYEPPAEPEIEATREDCVTCHEGVTPGWVHSWKGSAHADLDLIRSLPDSDSKACKTAIIDEVENNLRSMGKLGEGEQLAEVGCIDCHIGVNAETGVHQEELRMPDAAICGTCHLKEFAERESERDTLTWPHDQWPAGRPSHALDWKANVETTIWAAMEQREVAEGCSFCHMNQNKCDTCHTRHEFSVVEARKPETCATCHNGIDHNEYENFMLSKHGTVYQGRGDSWDWDVQLADAIEKGGMTAPTCQYCHMEYEGEFSHNVVRKVRWAFNPTPAIADNLDHPWFKDRQDSWATTCSNCHSDRFARSYLEFIDNGTIDGLKVEQDAKKIVTALYDDGLLPGQKTNRPAPPAPEKDGPAQFFHLFWAEGNSPSAVEYEYAEMWEHDVIKHYKGLAHMNPGGYTYSEGWSQLIKRYARIQDENTKLREMADLKARLAELETTQRGDLFELDGDVKRAGLAGGLGGVLLLLGLGMLMRSRWQPADLD
ncbi:MAG: multiheme c-type cytochrome [Geminicoccaceae bacterium]